MSNQNEKALTAEKNMGWLVTSAATCALLALGVLYAWSVIKQNIPDEWGWADRQKALPYSVACVVFSIMTMAGGRSQDKFAPRVVITAGGILAGLDVIISSLTTFLWMFTFSFGFLLGSGIGFVYGSGTPAAMKWFPAKMTGIICGIVVAGFGMGSAWVAPLAKYLIATQGIQTTLLWLGIGMFVAVVGFVQLLKSPPAVFIPGSGNAAVSSAVVIKVDYTPGEVVKTWQFYVVWLAFAFGAGAGLMIIGSLASIVTRQADLPALSAVAVSVLALGNGGGRVLAGSSRINSGANRPDSGFSYPGSTDHPPVEPGRQKSPGDSWDCADAGSLDRRLLRRQPGSFPRHLRGLLRFEKLWYEFRPGLPGLGVGRLYAFIDCRGN